MRQRSPVTGVVISVDGALMSPAEVGHLQLGFGQPWPHAAREVVIRMRRDALPGLLEAQYDQFVAETREMWPGEEQDEDELLARAGYPPFAEVVRDIDLLWFVMDACLTFDLLEAIAPSTRPSLCIHGLQSLHEDGDAVVLLAMAHRVGGDANR